MEATPHCIHDAVIEAGIHQTEIRWDKFKQILNFWHQHLETQKWDNLWENGGRKQNIYKIWEAKYLWNDESAECEMGIVKVLL